MLAKVEVAAQQGSHVKSRKFGCRSLRAVNLGPYPADLSEWMRQFKVKLVDVNRVSKGSPTGRISQFSALTVAGNKNVSKFTSALSRLEVSDHQDQRKVKENRRLKGVYLLERLH